MANEDAQMQTGDGTRADGRAPDELRAEFSAEVGALSRADGSAAVRIGGSHVTVAVFGPRPADARRGFEERAQIKATAQYAAFSGAPAPPAKGVDAREAALERLLEEALAATLLLERAPKALIEVHAFVAQCGGGEAAAAVMAAGLAAANAQLDLRCLPSAACVVTRGAHLLADPSPAEVAAADRAATAVMHSPRARVAHLTVSGIFSAAELADVIEVASDACAFYDEQLREVLLAAAAGAPG